MASVETAILFISVLSLKKPCGVRDSRTVMVISLVVTSVIIMLLTTLFCFCQKSGGGPIVIVCFVRSLVELLPFGIGSIDLISSTSALAVAFVFDFAVSVDFDVPLEISYYHIQTII